MAVAALAGFALFATVDISESVMDGGGAARMAPEPRYPVNLNTAPEEVLIACLQGLAGRRIFPHSRLGVPGGGANELLVEMDHPAAGRLRQPRPLGDFERTPLRLRRSAPLLGEQSDEIALEAGLTSEEIETLRRAGVLR